MIIASINGIPGVGFAEASCNGGPAEHRGKIRLSAANACCLRRLIDERAALVYNGPVWVNDRWQLRSFQLGIADVDPAVDGSCLVTFAEGNGDSRMELADAGSLRGFF